jgi:hypothetical protein
MRLLVRLPKLLRELREDQLTKRIRLPAAVLRGLPDLIEIGTGAPPSLATFHLGQQEVAEGGGQNPSNPTGLWPRGLVGEARVHASLRLASR